MKKILAFGASNSRASINKKLASWAAAQIKNAEVNLLDLNDFEMPIFSIDRENENGIPGEAKRFKSLIESCDGIVVSFAEHNGSYSAAFKNIMDWASRLEGKIWTDKPMFLLATSPGARGGATVLQSAAGSFPFNGGKVAGVFALPKFHENFSPEGGILDAALRAKFAEELAVFEQT